MLKKLKLLKSLIFTFLFLSLFIFPKVNNVYGQNYNYQDIQDVINSNKVEKLINIGPFQDLWNLLKRITPFNKENINSFNIINNSNSNDFINTNVENNPQIKITPENFLGFLENLWNQINDWFSEKIGVSFRDILKVVINIIIWFWELIIKILQELVSKI